MSFHLPADISFRKESLSSGWAYVFRHAEIGELGRIVIQGRLDGQSHITCEVVGDPQDPMTKQREAIFKPLGLELVQQMERAMGIEEPTTAQWVEPPARPAEPLEKIASTLMQCETCGANVALLIFADNAQDVSGLEDYARLMYPQVAKLNIPTWVIGPPSGKGLPHKQPSDMLKIWPEREPVFQSCPDDFNPIIEKLMATHCA
ncbi:MAG: hypothetical protein KDE46_00945 [Caldilineaceae bacterium]|nr:hypothetical protein [Caldilineaceae bacterium]